MTTQLLRKGWIAAVAINVTGVLIFSKGFTNTAINEADSVVMSDCGLIRIIVLGLADAASAAIRSDVSWLLVVFTSAISSASQNSSVKVAEEFF